MEKIAEGTPHEDRHPPSADVLFTVMVQVAALAECAQVLVPGIAGIMVEMGCRKAYVTDTDRAVFDDIGPVGGLAGIVAPEAAALVIPASVNQLTDCPLVGSPALLTAPLRPTETDLAADLRPVDGIEPAELRFDWHVTDMPQVNINVSRFPPMDFDTKLLHIRSTGN